MLDKQIKDFYKNLDKDFEEKETKPRILDIYQNKVKFKNKFGTVENLIEIHKYIFTTSYKEFAGLIRDKDISKGRTKFCLAEYIKENIEEINIKKDNTLQEIVDKYSDINMLHPFFEGNGRSGRVWLDLLLKEKLNCVINWGNISKEEYIECMIKSIYNTDDLKELINDNLTNDIENIDIYLKGIDSSYIIENMNNYTTKELLGYKIEENEL